MSLVVNTNVGSLNAQRSLAASGAELKTAMERLSSGKKINSAADDAAGFAIAERMTAQIRGLNMATKNANDGLSMLAVIENATNDVTDMLHRMRELAVQAVNDTNGQVDREFLQEEVSQLIQEIDRVATQTQYNGQVLLDGSFQNKSIQVGTEAGQTVSFSVESVDSVSVAAYQVTGDRIEAFYGNGAGANGNITDAADDVIINGNSLSKTIDVSAADSAKNVAANINAVSGETGVTATAKTHAHYYSTWLTDQTASLKINNVTTGEFVISSSNVLDAVDKINSISGSTGVTATATSDYKVLLYANDGKDILVENEKSILGQRVKAVSHDGSSVAAVSGTAGVKESSAALPTDAANTTWYIRSQETGETATLSFTAGNSIFNTLTSVNMALDNLSGKWAAGGDYHHGNED